MKRSLLILVVLLWAGLQTVWFPEDFFDFPTEVAAWAQNALAPGGFSPPGPEVRIAGARNEYLFFQLELNRNLSGCEVRVLGPSPDLGLRWQFFRLVAAPIHSETKWRPDALWPLDEPFPGSDPPSQILGVLLHIPQATPPGRHTLRLKISSPEGGVWVPVELWVYRFHLPEEMPLTIFGGFWHEAPPGTRARPYQTCQEIRVIKAYYKSLKEYGFNALGGSYPLPLRQVVAKGGLEDFPLYQELLAYALSTLKFRYFQIPRLKGWEEAHRPHSPFARLAANFYPLLRQYLNAQGWGARALNYLVDEPPPVKHQAVYQAFSLAKRFLPEVRTLCAGWQPAADFPRVIDIWAHQAARYQRDVAQAARRAGQEVWLYANRLHGIDHPLSHQRLIGWLLYRYDFTGYLVWGVNYWPEDPWTISPGPWDFYRRGTFYYPHPLTGLPVTTTRLEALRRGFQDYLYFRLLARAARQGLVPHDKFQTIVSQINQITKDLPRNSFPVTMEELEAVRLKVGELLDQATNQENQEEF